MKIFYPLLCYFPSEAGGPANTVYWLNKTIGKKNINSIVLSTNYGLKNKFLKNDWYSDFNIQCEFISGSLFSFLSIHQLQKLQNTDVIHFSSIFFKPTLIYIILGIILKKKIILSPRGELYESALSRKREKKEFYLKLIQIFQKRIHFHSTNPVETLQIKQHFQNAGSIIEIPNYIEIPPKQKVEVKNQLLFLGRINPIKNIDLLIRAFYKLPTEIISNFKLKIVGEAILQYEKDYLKHLISIIKDLQLENLVELSLGVYGEEKERLLAESYCLILPSKSENFGNVILEAICQGTPSIVTKNAPWEIIERENAGLWIEPDIKSITLGLKNLIELSASEYQKLRNNALNLAISHFDIEKNIYKWINFYNDVKNQ